MSARSAKTGKYVTPKFAKANKATTVVEKSKRKPRRAGARTVRLAAGDVRVTITNDDSLFAAGPVHLVPLPAVGNRYKTIELEPGASATVVVGSTRWFVEPSHG